MSTQTTTEAPAYMNEYYKAFTPTPYTEEQPDGTIVDRNTDKVVEVPATHPDFVRDTGAIAALHSVQVSFDRERE